jgi:arylformamidase
MAGMEIIATIGKKNYHVDMAHPHDISLAVRFDDKQTRAFGAPSAKREAFVDKGFIGDVKKGGSCNCDLFTFSPHLHGTHTECVGHIADTPIFVNDVIKNRLIPATVISVASEEARKTKDSYSPACRPNDLLITADILELQLLERKPDFLEALVIRTGKAGETLPPFFSIEAMHYLNECGVQHLLVDMPSIDRLDDEGKLTNHHIFWGIAPGSHAVDVKNISPKTVTELIVVSNTIRDGQYLLNLQVAPFASDAAPSRPVLFEVTPL